MANYIIRDIKENYDKRLVAEELYDCLRPVDRREIACVVDDVKREVRESLLMSDRCYAAVEKDSHALIAAWGLRKVKGEPGRLIWCLGTPRIERHWFAFAATSRRIVMKWARRYGRLYNAVAGFHTDARKWLEWCGARFAPAIEIRGEVFYPFEIAKGGNEDV